MQNFTLHIKYFDIKGYNPIFGIYWSVHIKENEKVDLDSFILKTPYNDKLSDQFSHNTLPSPHSKWLKLNPIHSEGRRGEGRKTYAKFQGYISCI